MSKKFLSAIIALSSMVVRLDAAVVSLADDFSLSSNPNGNWSYRKDTLLLAFQTPLSNGNPLIPALAPGFWGAGPDLNTQTPEIFKALENGSSIGLNNGDFLAGDNPLFPALRSDPMALSGASRTRNLGKAAWRATLTANENRREISRVSRLPAQTGDFSYRNTAY